MTPQTILQVRDRECASERIRAELSSALKGRTLHHGTMTHSTTDTIDSRYFHVFQAGPQTVIGFDGRCLAEKDAAWRCQTGLVELVRSHACQVLVVDLTSVDIVSSWILGVLAAIRQMGTEVHIYHPSEDVRDVMRITHLDELMPVRGEV